jgi:hypothetical protein
MTSVEPGGVEPGGDQAPDEQDPTAETPVPPANPGYSTPPPEGLPDAEDS